MTELIFVEGVSGVGKSTMVLALAEDLRSQGFRVKAYVEFDPTNPIDFYSTAYLPLDEYQSLCRQYPSALDAIRRNTVRAGNIMLVRYYDRETPLFEEPLLSNMAEKEFCYKPSRLVSLEEYTSAYQHVWKAFALNIREEFDFILFDGSLLHHPINDMMRNYQLTGEPILAHITALLRSLNGRERAVCYLETNEIGAQLKRAHISRKQAEPTQEQIDFWKARYENDRMVLDAMDESCAIYDVSHGGWDLARERIIKRLTAKRSL